MFDRWKNDLQKLLGLIHILLASAAVSFFNDRALAQIVPDISLGAENTVVTTDNGVNTITGGATRGSNLFHSFDRFSVNTGSSAHFNNPNFIKNIFSRVTGNSISNIDGKIEANSSANLFLINPNGIIFGPNASLNIGGSFLSSTAESIRFSDGSEFSTKQAQIKPLLTVNLPIGLQLPGNPQGISFKGSHLAVESGKTVALVGGEISLDSSQIVAPGGKVELGGLAEAGIVGLNLADNNLSLNFFDDLTKADVFLNNAAKVKVQKGNSGSISINAQNLELKKQSSLEAGIAKNAGSVDSQAGDINIDATEKITLDEASWIANIIRIGGKGRGGNIQISTGSIFLINGGSIDASTYGEGDSGSININARDTISLTGTTDCDVCSAILNNVGEFVSTPQTAEGNSGGINVDTGSLYITNEAYIDSSVYGQGHSGNINVNASNTIFITGDPNNNNNFASNIFSNVGDPDIPTAKGNSGDINITTNSLFLDNNATLNTVTFAKGDAGNINISVTQGSFKIIRGAAITSATVGKGNAGNINISVAKTLLIDRVLTDGFPSLISSTVGGVFPDIFEGRGEGGDINIKAGSVTISNGAWIAAASVLGEGNAGKISIETDSLTLNNRALIANATGAIGNAGEIEINAKSIYISGQISGNMPLSKALRSQFRIDNRGISSGLYTNTEKEAKGQGGNITINTDRLQLTDGGLINAQTLNKYAGGNVSINAKIFEAMRGGQIITSTSNEGNAGSISIQATESILLSGSDRSVLDRLAQFDNQTVRNIASESGLFASTSEESTGNGGNLDISTDNLTIDNGAKITASSEGSGDAGNIANIQVRTLTLKNGSIETKSKSGQGGNIENLQVKDLLQLRNHSQISTTAGTDLNSRGDGGKININAGFIVAFPQESSDITANAFSGKGGQVNITTKGIFGLETLTREELQTKLGVDSPQDLNPDRLSSNNITAISQTNPSLNGQVQLNSPEVDPSQGLIALPEAVVDVSRLIDRGCEVAKDSEVSKFEFSGRGGLPANSSEIISSTDLWEDWRSDLLKVDRPLNNNSDLKLDRVPLVEANNWIKNDKGKLKLIATVSNTTIANLGTNRQSCGDR